MCQLLGLSSSDPVRLTFDWDTFVMRGSRQGGNPDGWGVAYFEGRGATILREPLPAAASPAVQFLGRHAPRSNLVVSHVRRATRGERNLVNTQPFERVLGGRTHVFAHNGFVAPGGPGSASPWLQPQGDTDSERLFCRLLGYLEPLWQRDEVPAVEKRFDVLSRFAREILPLGASNFIYSDGINLFAHGHRQTLPGDAISDQPGLYVKLQRSQAGSDMTTPCEGLNAEGRCSRHALVATVPLSDAEWLPLEPGEVACFERGQRVV